MSFKISIIVPFFDEEQNVGPVVSEIRSAYPDAELICVDDGSRDRTFDCLAQQSGVRVHRLPRHLGQSAAIYAGLKLATGDVCVLLDGDGQSDVGDIKALLRYFPEYDLVNGCRAGRQDAGSRIVASRVANLLRNAWIGDGMRDTGGTPKAMKRECVDHLVPFDGLHRFIPALLRQAGFRIIEVPVAHRRRLFGVTKYTNWGRALRGAWDLIGVRWLLSRKFGARDLDLPPTTGDDESRQKP